jgi:Flp pilus assembly protein TadG
MSPTPCRPRRPATRPSRRRLGLRSADRPEDGQSLVEFSLILGPLMLILLGVIQFGFIFNTYITLSTATREAAREGSVYVYERWMTRSANDAVRNADVRDAFLGALNGLAKTSPQFATSSTWVSTTSGTTTTFTNGDLVVTYLQPDTVTANDPRAGYRLTVHATYHQDIVIPLIGALLPLDAGGRLPLTGEVTMVMN